jgi:hypothetical protein
LAAEVTDHSNDGPPDSRVSGERRPRPQYGEYATPQEQAKIIADSLPPVSPLLVPSAIPLTPQAPDASTRVSTVPPARSAGHRPRRWDLIVSAALLGYAAINVISQLVARDTLGTIATQFFISQGIGDYIPTALTASLGNALNFITLALFVLTVLVTVWMLRRGRVAFWVPIAGGVAATIVALVFVVILLQSDPALIAFLDRSRR